MKRLLGSPLSRTTELNSLRQIHDRGSRGGKLGRRAVDISRLACNPTGDECAFTTLYLHILAQLSHVRNETNHEEKLVERDQTRRWLLQNHEHGAAPMQRTLLEAFFLRTKRFLLWHQPGSHN